MRAGAAVILGARREAEGAKLVQEIEAADGRSIFLKTDVTDPAQVNALVASAVREFEGLDIAFNNAGIEGAGLHPLADETEENLRNVMDVNFFGVWNSMKAEVPALIERGGMMS
ncbi:MAG: NAD(P)-dependent dehydrogenase (short-subunit alcohol dehydrogenase family) [Planctomycetota bacterium]|jgi:NAD(P)-dependent dehydrogenase (short-subunit alcohol dehydrogenase family)